MVHFGRCYGNKGWAKMVEKYIFVSKISSLKLSESFRSVAHGVLRYLRKCTGGGGHNGGTK